MARRKIVQIDEEKCTGCGQCVPACAEGAIQIVDGKARLVSDVYCDGLGACLGECPENAITIIEREAEDFDAEAARRHLEEVRPSAPPEGSHSAAHACPGARMMEFHRPSGIPRSSDKGANRSELAQWPVQLRLLSPNAPYFMGADLLVAADCSAFAHGDFHRAFLRGRAVVVACPKLDDTDGYVEKLAEIMRRNHLKKVTVVHMEVPCCSGLVYLVEKAKRLAGVEIPTEEVTLSLKGEVVARNSVEG